MIKVLDHGYVKFIEKWGSDERIIEAARMSTGKGFKGWGPFDCPSCVEKGILPKETYVGPGSLTAPQYINICKTCDGKGCVLGDEKLLAFLYKNKHMSPFEMCGMTIEVQAPIFVFREWHRHRTQSYNEMSARYTPIPDLHYVPSIERIMMDGGKNKQAQGIKSNIHDDLAGLRYREDYIEKLKKFYKDTQEFYQLGLNWGVPKELARLVLPVARYSRMMASANLRNWLQFLTLRLPSNAQWEIRQYAQVVSLLIEQNFPRTHELFKKGMNNASNS